MIPRRISLIFFLVCLVLGLLATGLSAANSITSPDTSEHVGDYSSLVLDADGNPVVSYYDRINGDLKLLHCNDPNCAGNDESITNPDWQGWVGYYPSLVLDASGNPVISYYELVTFEFMVMHCNDPNCAGGDESITMPDTSGEVGYSSSLMLDAAGNPVIGYRDGKDDNLKLLHCNDPNCSGGDESITTPDSTGTVGLLISLALDAAGNPVIAYHAQFPPASLNILHCNDPNCADGDESITYPDRSTSGESHASLKLDASGNPVVSYRDVDNNDLKLLHCNDPNCAGGGESITRPDSEGTVGRDTSLELDRDGNPVVSYRDITDQTLNILHCNDPNCAGGDDSITSPDNRSVYVGAYTSLELDEMGNPVVSYQDVFSWNLKLLHCDTPLCSPNIEPVVDAGTDQALDEGQLAVFHGTAADAAGDRLTFSWDFGDGTTEEGTLSPQHLYVENGEYTVTLTVTDDGGLSTSDTIMVTVNNVVPVVDAGENVSVLEGGATPFTGTYSDPGTEDGHTFLWDFGDGETVAGTMMPVHAYADNGVYTVTFTVADDDRGVGSDLLRVVVSNVAPEVDVGADMATPEGQELSFAALLADAGVADQHTISWDFGNGLTASGTLTPTQTYFDNGVYTVTMTATDDDGGVGTDSLRVEVSNVAPEVDAGEDLLVWQGATLSFAGTFSDAGKADSHTIVWDFGDGETEHATLTPEHVYAEPGLFTATLTVSDDDGGIGTDTLVVTVKEVFRLFAPLSMR